MLFQPPSHYCEQCGTTLDLYSANQKLCRGCAQDSVAEVKRIAGEIARAKGLTGPIARDLMAKNVELFEKLMRELKALMPDVHADLTKALPPGHQQILSGAKASIVIQGQKLEPMDWGFDAQDEEKAPEPKLAREGSYAVGTKVRLAPEFFFYATNAPTEFVDKVVNQFGSSAHQDFEIVEAVAQPHGMDIHIKNAAGQFIKGLSPEDIVWVV